MSPVESIQTLAELIRKTNLTAHGQEAEPCSVKRYLVLNRPLIEFRPTGFLYQFYETTLHVDVQAAGPLRFQLAKHIYDYLQRHQATPKVDLRTVPDLIVQQFVTHCADWRSGL